ncbi:hypothetical protein ACCO45_004880 [Purpureocillium lilacinum]|uniref:Uncharacterized protein n=1 Tax=Purpureocillium lilacinum TaxID=33203 RepID=A0ACC4DUR0_PURLI
MPPEPAQAIIRSPAEIANIAPSSFPASLRGNVSWRTILSSSSQSPSSSLCAGIAECPSWGSLALHRHAQAELYFILDGSGEVEIGGVRHAVCGGTVVWIPGDVEHGVFCGGDEKLRWLYAFPEGRFEDVVYHFRDEDGSG